MLYIVTFAFFSILSYREMFGCKTKNSYSIDKILRAICIVFLLLLTTIRGGTNGDYITYKETFDSIDTSVFSIKNFAFEPLYSTLQWICKTIVNDFQFFLFIIGLLVIVLEVKYMKSFRVDCNGLTFIGKTTGIKVKQQDSNKYFFTLLLIFWGLYHANIFVIRSTIALMICLYSTKFIVSKRKLSFLFFVLIATGFHYSALCFLPAYWIYYFKSRLSVKLLIVFIASILLMIFLDDILLLIGKILGYVYGEKINNKITEYVTQGFTYGAGDSLASKGIILFSKAAINIGLLIFIGCRLWIKNRNNTLYVGCLNLYLFGCILYLATLSLSYAFARVSIYYNIFQIPLFLFCFEKHNRNQKKRIWALLIVYLFFRMTVNLITNGTFNFITFYQ